MSAAAACRGSSKEGGKGDWANMVYPRTTRMTCADVCKASKYFTECDASVSIMGYMGRVEAANQIAGRFYNYGCGSLGHPGMRHEERLEDSWISTAQVYLGYCCCRNEGVKIPAGLFP